MENGNKKQKGPADQTDDLVPQEKFSPTEEAELVQESDSHKSEATSLFKSKKYEAALGKYDQAVTVCPNYLDYEVAVLKSNIALCQLKLSEWKAAVASANECLDRLSKVDDALQAEQKAEEEENEVEAEIISEGAKNAGPPLPPEESQAAKARQTRRKGVQDIRVKALLRRAKARVELGGCGDLSSALEDYCALSKMDDLRSEDRKFVEEQLRVLPKQAAAAQEREMGEMLGKLKDVSSGDD